jgi:site-specific recombinase XerD
VLERYLQYLTHVRHLSPNTLTAYRRDMELYFAFLREQELTLEKMDAVSARSFVGYLSRRGLSSRSINRVLSAVRGLYRFLERVGVEVGNPFASILELLYSTGCRVSELAAASLTDLDFKGSTLRVVGKGNKERLVFIGRAACKRLREYLLRRRALKLDDPEGRRALLINRRGGRLTVRGIQTIVERLLERSPLDKAATAHTFRHSFATHVLRKGADIRVVQELLGHASLSTTQVYTHLDMERLQKVYGSAHPHASRRVPIAQKVRRDSGDGETGE